MPYGFTASITVDNTKVSGSSNHPNFVFPVSGTYDGTGTEPDIRTVANGGNVENTASGGANGSLTVPADLAFYDDASGTTQYDHEIEYYNAATGEIVAWVRIPSLLYNSDTTLYMHYGDNAVSTSQENIAAVWANYVAVYHLADTPTGSANDIKDSKGTYHGTSSGGVSSYASGSVNKGMDFDGTDGYIDLNNAVLGDTDFTISFWNRWEGSGNQWIFDNSNGSGVQGLTVNNNIRARVDDTGSNGGVFDTAVTINDSTWRHHAVLGNTAGNASHMVNGAANGGTLNISGYGDITGNADFLIASDANVGAYWNGQLDEFRIAASLLTADYITTEYNSMVSPSTFYTMGSETSAATASARGSGLSTLNVG